MLAGREVRGSIPLVLPYCRASAAHWSGWPTSVHEFDCCMRMFIPLFQLPSVSSM